MNEEIKSFLLKSPTRHQWEKIKVDQHHGICIPLSALHSQKSFGIGDFGDLFPLIDWCSQVGFDCIQLLPLNDTGDDPSPYNALSSCALDPIYISFEMLPDKGDLSQERINFQPFDTLPRLAHNEVRHQKNQFLRAYFDKHFRHVEKGSDYQNFIQTNPWLLSYAQFKAYKDEYGGKHWQQWPKEKQHFTPSLVHSTAIHFHFFLQFIAFLQMQSVKSYAEKKNILLKGDISILVSPDSADVWENRSLFDLNYIAGAPPDYYNPLGQKWGFPIYHWGEMRNTEFAWWKERLRVAESLYHLYRIDHVVGFFRIWAIRPNEQPKEGRYLPLDPQEWGHQGREILEMMIKNSSMLPMAEDLGSIPNVVYETLHNLGICGTKVIRWQRQFGSDNGFAPYSEYDPISLTTVSTADSEPLTLWWKSQKQEAKDFAIWMQWPYEPELEKWQLQKILTDSHHTKSLFHINLLQEYLSLFPDLVANHPEEERINIPGTLLPTNWTYRFTPSLEQILSHESLAIAIREILHP